MKEKGLIDKPFVGKVQARRRPEVMKLRFDPDKSPPEGIPSDIREPLYRLLVKHADGAVKRSGRRWIDFDPFSDPSLKMPR